MTDKGLLVHEGKREYVEYKGVGYSCYAIKTPVIGSRHSLEEVLQKYAAAHLRAGDILFLSEKMVACTQGRAIPRADIRPGFWARFLSRFVVRRPGGIGLGMPETMQAAIDECGLHRILPAAAAGALGKLVGRSGWFYRVAGYRAAAIDGPCPWTIPPYNQCVVLAPRSPTQAACRASEALGGTPVVLADLNDFGGRILGVSHHGMNTAALLELLAQNPLGQAGQSTPVGILRPVAKYLPVPGCTQAPACTLTAANYNLW